MKTNSKVITLFMALLIICTNTSCGRTNTQNDEYTNENNSYNVTYDAKNIYQDVNELLATGDYSELQSFAESFEFNLDDICTEESRVQAYFSESAYYIQTGTYMYRFQLNEDGKIESYIKYNLEA